MLNIKTKTIEIPERERQRERKSSQTWGRFLQEDTIYLNHKRKKMKNWTL